MHYIGSDRYMVNLTILDVETKLESECAGVRLAHTCQPQILQPRFDWSKNQTTSSPLCVHIHAHTPDSENWNWTIEGH